MLIGVRCGLATQGRIINKPATVLDLLALGLRVSQLRAASNTSPTSGWRSTGRVVSRSSELKLVPARPSADTHVEPLRYRWSSPPKATINMNRLKNKEPKPERTGLTFCGVLEVELRSLIELITQKESVCFNFCSALKGLDDRFCAGFFNGFPQLQQVPKLSL